VPCGVAITMLGAEPRGAAFHQSRKHRWASVGCDGKRGYFALGSFLQNETIGCGFPRTARYAEDAAAGFRAGN